MSCMPGDGALQLDPVAVIRQTTELSYRDIRMVANSH